MLLQASQTSDVTAGSVIRTVWGLDTLRLHDHYWAAHGVQVIRPGDLTPVSPNAVSFLLLDREVLALFAPEMATNRQQWVPANFIYLRLHMAMQFRERIVTDQADRFVRFERLYHGEAAARLTRVILTYDPRVAALWQVATDANVAARNLRKVVARDRRATVSAMGGLFDLKVQAREADFLRELMRAWTDPQTAISRARERADTILIDPDANVPADVRFVGPVWVGAGRKLDGATMVIGPAVLWDDPAARPAPQEVKIEAIRPSPRKPALNRSPMFVRRRPTHLFVKRLFDIAVASIALLITLPFYPIVMLLILLEDGRPFFFSHRRETLNGRKFSCIKFRSMQKKAEKLKLDLARLNQADGPQFFLEDDPRLTRVGRFIRKYQIDEFPQFINVLLGDMSIVGPRPSPFAENQFCPQWREARLSVRPGITGLWQVKRTRRKDQDFQEWIRYDLEYVENANLFLDSWIILQTAYGVLSRLIAAMRLRRPDSDDDKPGDSAADAVESAW